MNKVNASSTQGNGFVLVIPLTGGTFSKTLETRAGSGSCPCPRGTSTGLIGGSCGPNAVMPASIVSWPRKQPYTHCPVWRGRN